MIEPAKERRGLFPAIGWNYKLYNIATKLSGLSHLLSIIVVWFYCEGKENESKKDADNFIHDIRLDK